MNLYKTTIIPLSNFATKLQGDTIFGQLCWAIRFTFGEERLEKLLNNYETAPFLIVSNGFANDYLPKPSMPSNYLSENPDEKKENRKKIWLKLDELANGKYYKARTNKEINYINKAEAVVKNTINYKTFKTEDGFDPYAEEESSISKHDIYFLLDENQFLLDELKKSFQTLSDMGFGKNSTIGKGRFEFLDFEKVKINMKSNIFMTLSPCNLQGLKCKEVFYTPFTKFPKHGALLSTSSPFKKPLLLAQSTSVVIFNDIEELQYIGKAIKGYSAHEKTFHQGYSIVLPLKDIEI